jgi:hypothetical protein
MSRKSEFAAFGVFATAFTVAFLPAAATAPKAPRFAPLSAWDAAALERARTGAARRLEAPACHQVLSDFEDPEGRTLLGILESWRQTPSEYLLRTITFLDGSTLQNCKTRTVLLVTSRGRPPVFVCPAGGPTPGSRFARIQIENPSLAEVMVIHEMLHTLGLGENPPTTFEITDRVMARCGDRALAQRRPSTK